MPDDIFDNPLLVAIYDDFDGLRVDLDHYFDISKELGAHSIVDIGCGTGCLAIRLANDGFCVTGVDPARASIEFAGGKSGANKVQWIIGDAESLPKGHFDLAIMTGNVAQVFLSDADWDQTLKAIHKCLSKNGHFVFEVRDPSKQAWLDWTREKTFQCLNISGVGDVEGWCDLIDVTNDLVSFRWTYVFLSDGKVIASDSTLRFRTREQIENSLHKAGYTIIDIRDAPDRPGKEFVFITSVR